MQFKDAAFEVLKREGKPLHYREITSRALDEKILDTEGSTPSATMGALLYTDTLKPNSRFQRGEMKGTFVIKAALSGSIQSQINGVQSNFKKNLLEFLHKMDPEKFEDLIRLLLEEMGFDEAKRTSFGNDKGVDVRGILRSNPLSEVKIVIQAKRWKGNVGSGIVRDLRGSLRVADSEQGLIITPSGYTASAIKEACSSGKTPIRLIDGNQLVELLIQYNVGVKNIEYLIPTLDSDFWTEVLGVTPSTGKGDKPQIDSPLQQSKFPIEIQATHNGMLFNAQLLTLEGSVRYNGVVYQTPSSAAKVIVTDWKTVNGWNFWRYFDEKSGNFEKIGKLRKR